MTESQDHHDIEERVRRPRIWILAAVAVVVILAVVALFVPPFQLAQRIGGGYTSIAGAPYFHPDGLVLSTDDAQSDVRVKVETLPREAFLAGEADGIWQAAYQALPEHLTALSPIYTISERGDGLVRAHMSLPNGAEPLERLALYAWDEETGTWIFVPSRIDEGQQVIVFSPLGDVVHVMAFHDESVVLNTGVVVSAGSGNAWLGDDIALLEGVIVAADSSLSGEPAARPSGAESALAMPLVVNDSFTSYGDADALSSSLAELSSGYDGLVLDFVPGEDYTEFIATLHDQGLRVEIVVHASNFGSYDLVSLGQAADRIWLDAGDNPGAYLPGGEAESLLAELTGAVPRQKAGLLVSGLPVDVVDATASPLSFEQAVVPFGEVAVAEGYLASEEAQIEAGRTLPLLLMGSVTSMGYDDPLGMNYLTYLAEDDALHHVFFGSGLHLSMRFELARRYGLGAIAVEGVFASDVPSYLAGGLSAFAASQAFDAPAPLALVWRVKDMTGAVVQENAGDLALAQFMWQETAIPGKYSIEAAFQGDDRENSFGEIAVDVVEAFATEVEQPEEEPEPAAVAVIPPSTPSTDPAPTPDPDPLPAPPPPVAGGIIGGGFELGGQTHSLAHPAEMGAAGMSWVKFQYKWHEGDDPSVLAGRIDMAHANGFKVLLSIPGASYPSSINYQAYVDFLAGVASYGPDAIEVWNEMNLDREWPVGQINGESYVVNMLAPAYNAIKTANPGVMVISGAPAPTGFWGGCAPEGCDDWLYIQQMAQAGAANYMDCMGIHYNEGIIPPSQSSGDPRSEHYTRYFSGMLDLYYGTIGRPVCFTELGYLSPEGFGDLPSNFAWAGETSVAEHAAWLAEAAILSSQSGKVRLMIVFNVDFTVWEPYDPQAGYAMIRPDGSCPACATLGAAW